VWLMDCVGGYISVRCLIVRRGFLYVDGCCIGVWDETWCWFVLASQILLFVIFVLWVAGCCGSVVGSSALVWFVGVGCIFYIRC